MPAGQGDAVRKQGERQAENSLPSGCVGYFGLARWARTLARTLARVASETASG